MKSRTAAPARSADTETAILEAARDLLAEGGLGALSMRGVAARVGVSATAIYNYFENKQALVKRVVTQGFERFAGYLRGAIADVPVGSAERLRALGEAYIRFALENREYFRVIFASHAETPQDIEELPEGGGYELFRQTVVDAMESGAIREADADLVVLYLWAHVHGLVTLLLTCEPDARCEHTGRRLSAPELFARFSEFVLYGLRPDGAVRAETGSAAAS
ncbi:MAG: TetR/AcrR family transcriptional regulator [Gemmatimonadota bacterium]|nr:MAG: TetR/AcrR family transcriptional regulator [Gemmatimonadota bacterium]